MALSCRASSWAFCLWFNVANLGHLVAASSGGYIALVMLFMFNGIVFAGVQFAIAVMRMADGGGKGPTLRQHSAPHALRPVAGSGPARPKG